MSQITNSSSVTSGDYATAEQYNDLRDDLIAVEANSPPIGSVIMFAGTTTSLPDGYMLCDGSTINRTTYSTLFSRLGTTFGSGDGSTTFELPDLQDKFIIGAGSTYSRGETGGATSRSISHTHTGPSHRHTTSTHRHTGPSHSHSTSNHSHGTGSLFAKISLAGSKFYVQHGSTASWWANNYISASNTVYGQSRLTGVSMGGSTASSGSGNTGSAGNGYTGYGGGANTGYGGTGNTGSAGGTVNTVPPYTGLFYLIKVE